MSRIERPKIPRDKCSQFNSAKKLSAIYKLNRDLSDGSIKSKLELLGGEVMMVQILSKKNPDKYGSIPKLQLLSGKSDITTKVWKSDDDLTFAAWSKTGPPMSSGQTQILLQPSVEALWKNIATDSIFVVSAEFGPPHQPFINDGFLFRYQCPGLQCVFLYHLRMDNFPSREWQNTYHKMWKKMKRVSRKAGYDFYDCNPVLTNRETIETIMKESNDIDIEDGKRVLNREGIHLGPLIYDTVLQELPVGISEKEQKNVGKYIVSFLNGCTPPAAETQKKRRWTVGAPLNPLIFSANDEYEQGALLSEAYDNRYEYYQPMEINAIGYYHANGYILEVLLAIVGIFVVCIVAFVIGIYCGYATVYKLSKKRQMDAQH